MWLYKCHDIVKKKKNPKAWGGHRRSPTSPSLGQVSIQRARPSSNTAAAAATAIVTDQPGRGAVVPVSGALRLDNFATSTRDGMMGASVVAFPTADSVEDPRQIRNVHSGLATTQSELGRPVSGPWQDTRRRRRRVSAQRVCRSSVRSDRCAGGYRSRGRAAFAPGRRGLCPAGIDMTPCISVVTGMIHALCGRSGVVPIQASIRCIRASSSVWQRRSLRWLGERLRSAWRVHPRKRTAICEVYVCRGH